MTYLTIQLVLVTLTFVNAVVFDMCDLDCIDPMKLNCSDLHSVNNGKRCCVMNDTELTYNSYTGVDLAGCNLTSISNLFLYMKNLKMLKLPHSVECPGGGELWKNITTDGDVTSCLGEQSTCKVLHVECPNSNSYCHDVAPRLTECLCLPGFHGYKCLQKSTFPSIPFIIGICVGTTVVSGLMWFTQRRHAKKNV